MPMTTKDPRGLRHWRHRSTGKRGACSVPPHSSLLREYKQPVVPVPNWPHASSWAGNTSGALSLGAEGCNLHYALCEIGPWQGSVTDGV